MELGVRELRDGLSRHLVAVRAGTSITVTDHGKPVARLVPHGSESGLESFLDDRLVELVQGRANKAGVSCEQMIAELVSLGLASLTDARPLYRSGFPVMAGAPARPVTDELVAAYRDDV